MYKPRSRAVSQRGSGGSWTPRDVLDELLRLEDQYGCLAAAPRFLTEEQRAMLGLNENPAEQNASAHSEDGPPESKSEGDPKSHSSVTEPNYEARQD